jgi:hypothetical protein
MNRDGTIDYLEATSEKYIRIADMIAIHALKSCDPVLS